METTTAPGAVAAVEPVAATAALSPDEAEIAAVYERAVDLERRAHLGDEAALADLSALVPDGYLEMVAEDREFIEASQGQPWEITERELTPDAYEFASEADGTIMLSDCMVAVDGHLLWGAQDDGTPPMAFETRTARFASEGGRWVMASFERSNDGLFGKSGCVPSAHAERIEAATLRFLELNLALLNDHELLVPEEMQQVMGDPLLSTVMASSNKVRDVAMPNAELYRAKAEAVDNELTWHKPIPGGFIYRVATCTFSERGRTYERVGTDETKADERFPAGSSWRGVWYVQSELGADGTWTDRVINSAELVGESGCWQSEEFGE